MEGTLDPVLLGFSSEVLGMPGRERELHRLMWGTTVPMIYMNSLSTAQGALLIIYT